MKTETSAGQKVSGFTDFIKVYNMYVCRGVGSVCLNESTVFSNVSVYYETVPEETYIYTALCVSEWVRLCLFISLPCLPTRFLFNYETTLKRDIQLALLTDCIKKKNLRPHDTVKIRIFISLQVSLQHMHRSTYTLLDQTYD